METVAEFLKKNRHIKPSEKPKAIIMVGPPASGKKTISQKLFAKKFLILDVDELRDPPTNIKNIDEAFYRFSTQKKAERRRCEIMNRAIMLRLPILVHALSGSRYWYDEAINLKFSGYQVIFIFLFNDKDQVLKNLAKRTREQRETQGYAITADRDFIEYSFESIPELASIVAEDNMKAVSAVFLMDQNGKDLKIPREDIPRALKSEYSKPATIPEDIRN